MSAQYIYTTYKLSRRHPPDKQVLTDISLSFHARSQDRRARVQRRRQVDAAADHGWTRRRLRRAGATGADASVGLLSQEPELDPNKDVRGNVEDGVAEVKGLLDRFNELAANYSDETADEFARLQDQIDAADAWTLDTKLDYAMDALRCPPSDADVTTLSGGERRRVALCRLLLPSLTYCCSTSRPTTSTPSPSAGLNATSLITRARSWQSPTIVTSWTTSPAGFSSSTAAGGSPIRATTPAGSSRRRSGWNRSPEGRRAPAHDQAGA